MPFILVLLGENTSNYSIRGICFQLGLKFWLIMIEYWCIGQSSFQFPKCFLTLVVPHKGHFFLGQLVQWLCNLAVVLDKSSIEIAESKEGLHSLNCTGYIPVMNHLGFLRINLDAIRRQYEP